MTALVSIGTGSTVQWPVVEVFLKQEGISASALTFFSSNGANDLGIASGATSGLATCSASNQNREAFADFARCLTPGARLYVYDALRDAARQGTVQKDLLLSGFADTKIDTYSGIVLVQATKPNYDIGAKSLLRKPAAAAGAAQPAAAAKTWGISADDNDELMDEDELLTAEDKQPVLAANDDCDVGKAGKKACKNCTCGRAEQESTGVKLTAEMLENPTSACGNCNLGDAFRCSSCPYRGLPAFESGKKIQLGSDLLTADI